MSGDSKTWYTTPGWPGGVWGAAMAQVRKSRRLTQSDISDYLNVSLASVRSWENGVSLPDRTLWSKFEEAMGVPVPDPRVAENTPVERELIDTLLSLTDELRALRIELAARTVPRLDLPANEGSAQVIGVAEAAAYMGVTISLIRRLVAERRIAFHKLGRRVMFRQSDLDQFIQSGRREPGRSVPGQLQSAHRRSPRKSSR